MSDTLVYTLSNETTGVDSEHDSLNQAFDAVNRSVANGDEWVVAESTRGRPRSFRWVAEGRGHVRSQEDTPAHVRRGPSR
jgi:hypothetical protein